ncbi:MAG: phenylacetic acid degradation bifunctional protein PaaZ [Crocinitomicaceae bacterium]|nr:phenylacetic acid degradation bifunctional protein PaaZ [Crocinitomicaceae bacterium]
MEPTLLQHFVKGQWLSADERDSVEILHAIHGNVHARASNEELDWQQVLNYGREVGNPALRALTFQERGLMLKALALHLHSKKEHFYQLSQATGATRIDSWIDIEGGIGNLFSYASLRRQFGDQPFALDGDAIGLSKGGSFVANHLLVPKEGVAVHINAFNFPVWGMLEKVAVNWLAGMPAIVKPATATSFLTEGVVREIIRSGILPPGAIQLICGPARQLLDHVDERDVVTFTGSASTGMKLRAHPNLNAHSVPFNMEADSLNSCILGSHVQPGDAEFELFIKEVRKEMTVKCGQKCTAVRRVFVPEPLIDDVQEALVKALSKSTKGDPNVEGVRMGALVNSAQKDEVLSQVKKLESEATCVYRDETDPIGDVDPAAFMGPVLLRMDDPDNAQRCHDVEAFGPVSTLMPYRDLDHAIALTNRGKGSLCCSLVSHDSKEAQHFVMGAAVMHGRILILDRDCAKESTGHGSPLPLLVHGGPGRAGGGEEMGGLRGIRHYMQRTALQGSPSMLSAITQTYHAGGQQTEAQPHLFQQYFEDLIIGHTVTTAKHTITEADIVNFANVSGDHFYAHVDETSLDGTIFEKRVAHGYYLLSKAAGLFVDPKKGPVLLNYGVEEARFTKPVYPGTTVGVRLTVKEKVEQEKRSEDDIRKGIVKFYVDMYDNEGESVAIATILTMVKLRNQD